MTWAISCKNHLPSSLVHRTLPFIAVGLLFSATLEQSTVTVSRMMLELDRAGGGDLSDDARIVTPSVLLREPHRLDDAVDQWQELDPAAQAAALTWLCLAIPSLAGAGAAYGRVVDRQLKLPRDELRFAGMDLHALASVLIAQLTQGQAP